MSLLLLPFTMILLGVAYGFHIPLLQQSVIDISGKLMFLSQTDFLLTYVPLSRRSTLRRAL